MVPFSSLGLTTPTLYGGIQKARRRRTRPNKPERYLLSLFLTLLRTRKTDLKQIPPDLMASVSELGLAWRSGESS